MKNTQNLRECSKDANFRAQFKRKIDFLCSIRKFSLYRLCVDVCDGDLYCSFWVPRLQDYRNKMLLSTTSRGLLEKAVGCFVSANEPASSPQETSTEASEKWRRPCGDLFASHSDNVFKLLTFIDLSFWYLIK